MHGRALMRFFAKIRINIKTYALGMHTLVPAIKKFTGLKWGLAISNLDGVMLLAIATEERLSPGWITYSRVVPWGHSI